jgi:hypothetical protein
MARFFRFSLRAYTLRIFPKNFEGEKITTVHEIHNVSAE